MSRIADRQARGLVFNIQKYSVHDGPGIRTIVFLKGCYLRCRWCSNPESQHADPQLAYNEGRCLGLDKCTRCLQVCTRGALVRLPDDTLAINRSLCAGCSMPCAENCPAEGLLVYGKMRSVEDVLKVVAQDEAFYARSKGGMTLSGGEPLFQKDFALALLREARARYIRTAIETCGMVAEDVMLEACQYLNYVLYDIKHMDPQVHKRRTSRSNEQILSNFRAMCATYPDKPVLARTPVIPGFNDTPEAIRAIAEFLLPFGDHVEYEMLPYHRLGTQKYIYLGRRPPMGEATLDNDLFARLQGVAQEVLGSRVRIPR